MTIQGCNSISVIDDHGAAVAVHELSKTHNPISWGNNTSSDVTRNIHSTMECAFTVEWINALTKRTGNPSHDRPQRRRRCQAHPVSNAGVSHVTHRDAHRCRSRHGRVP